jgi:hypothetical protein
MGLSIVGNWEEWLGKVVGERDVLLEEAAKCVIGVVSRGVDVC